MEMAKLARWSSDLTLFNSLWQSRTALHNKEVRSSDRVETTAHLVIPSLFLFMIFQTRRCYQTVEVFVKLAHWRTLFVTNNIRTVRRSFSYSLLGCWVSITD